MEKSVIEIAIELCEKLGIKYHLGDGISTIDGKELDLDKDCNVFEPRGKRATMNLIEDSCYLGEYNE